MRTNYVTPKSGYIVAAETLTETRELIELQIVC